VTRAAFLIPALGDSEGDISVMTSI
jgi:hypothetical protein